MNKLFKHTQFDEVFIVEQKCVIISQQQQQKNTHTQTQKIRQKINSQQKTCFLKIKHNNTKIRKVN